MSGFSVHAESIDGHVSRLAGLAAELEGSLRAVAATAGAADGTPAEGALGDLVGHLAAVVPHFGHATDTLSAALAGAGASYTTTETVLAAGMTRRQEG